MKTESKLIVLSNFDDIVDFVIAAEKCRSRVILKKPGDASEYDGKSILSVVMLMGRDIEVHYDQRDKGLEAYVMKYRAPAQNS